MSTTLCIPSGWEIAAEDFSDILAPRTILSGPNGERLSLSTAAIGVRGEGQSELALMDAGLGTAGDLGRVVGGPEDGPPISVANFDGALRLDESRQQRVTGDDGRGMLVIVSVGPDRVSRILLVEANSVEELDALVAELVPTIVFRRADLQVSD